MIRSCVPFAENQTDAMVELENHFATLNGSHFALANRMNDGILLSYFIYFFAYLVAAMLCCAWNCANRLGWRRLTPLLAYIDISCDMNYIIANIFEGQNRNEIQVTTKCMSFPRREKTHLYSPTFQFYLPRLYNMQYRKPNV